MDFKALRKMLSMQPSEQNAAMPPVQSTPAPAAVPGAHIGQNEASNLNKLMQEMDEQDRPMQQPTVAMPETEEEKFNRIKMMMGK